MHRTLMHIANTFTQVFQGTGNLNYIFVVAGTMLYLLSYKSLKYFYRLLYVITNLIIYLFECNLSIYFFEFE